MAVVRPLQAGEVRVVARPSQCTEWRPGAALLASERRWAAVAPGFQTTALGRSPSASPDPTERPQQSHRTAVT